MRQLNEGLIVFQLLVPYTGDTKGGVHMNEFNIRQIGQRIASKRRELNMTQSNLADQLLVSYQAISNWERGNTLPDIEKIAPASNNFSVIH